MSTIRRKAVLISLLISVIINACNVKGPESISWTEPSSEPSFNEVDGVGINSSNTQPAPNTYTGGFSTVVGVCSLVHENAGICFGDTEMGYRKMDDGSYTFFLDGICYRIEAANIDDINAARTAMKVMSEKTNDVNKLADKTGLESIALITTVIAALGTCGVIGSATPVGWLCLAAAVGVAATLGLTINQVIEIYTVNHEIEDQRDVVETVLSGKKLC